MSRSLQPASKSCSRTVGAGILAWGGVDVEASIGKDDEEDEEEEVAEADVEDMVAVGDCDVLCKTALMRGGGGGGGDGDGPLSLCLSSATATSHCHCKRGGTPC